MKCKPQGDTGATCCALSQIGGSIVLLSTLFIVLAACAPIVPGSSFSAAPAITQSPAVVNTDTPAPIASPADVATPTAVATTAAPISPTRTISAVLKLPPSIEPVARVTGEPDDLALLPDGEILFSDLTDGTIDKIDPSGQVSVLARGLDEPEGIVVLPDGSLVVAEQGNNRLMRLAPNSVTLSVWLPLENKTGNAGVDGIALDSTGGDLIVPDSPNGRVLRVNIETRKARVIAQGLTRPTGVAVERGGSLLVADEFGNAVKRIRPDGGILTLGRFSEPDDVAVDSQGRIFVASLGDNSIRLLDAQSGAIRLIATVPSPQGFVLDADGNLIVTSASEKRILRVRIH